MESKCNDASISPVTCMRVKKLRMRNRWKRRLPSFYELFGAKTIVFNQIWVATVVIRCWVRLRCATFVTKQLLSNAQNTAKESVWQLLPQTARLHNTREHSIQQLVMIGKSKQYWLYLITRVLNCMTVNWKYAICRCGKGSGHTNCFNV